MTDSTSEMILYRTGDGRTQIQLRAVDGTVWLTQADIATLFDTTPQNITQHIRTIYADGEHQEERTCKQLLQVRQEGSRQVRRTVQAYNLDMILAVGYRVRSPRAVQFRQWATTVLREYLVKGFALNDERLKEPGGHDYFDELLARIRDIRASEKRFYQKVRDVFAQTSVDYDGSSEMARRFFATIQNKLVYAVTGRTAAELIVMRADAEAPNMGLTNWAGARVRKSDVTISKNYLNAEEIDELNRLTTMFLDYAEDRTRRRQQIRMAEWVTQTDRFLDFNERQVLNNAGRVSQADMQRIAHERFDAFDDQRRARELAEADREAAEEFAALEAEARRLLEPGEADHVDDWKP
ncbi:virulence RhuM family protein [Micromonospora lutea]|uniref:virulence RhuM family protein n=1 Tax=Micromonospora lutea TaxID=419825 RepID=UPI0019517046|nr:virulence RhuM family protein [Micromonospora lutea]